MKTIFTLAVSMVMLASTAFAQLSDQQYKRLCESTGTVVSEYTEILSPQDKIGGIGSCYIFKRGKYIFALTAAHCVAPGKTKRKEVQYPDGSKGTITKHFLLTKVEVLAHKSGRVFPSEARVLYIDEKNDLALVLIKDARHFNPSLEIAEKNVRIGEKLHIMGTPRHFGNIDLYIRGYASFLGRRIICGPIDTDGLQINGVCAPGVSGSGVFNNNWELVGIFSVKATGVENVGTAVSLKMIRAFLKKNAEWVLKNEPVPEEVEKKYNEYFQKTDD